MPKWTLAVTMALIPVTLCAEEVREKHALTAVETWVQSVTADARPDAVVEFMEPFLAEGPVVAYIAHLEGGGFCLGGADDLLLPVYLYSPVNTFDPENREYQYILEDIAGRLTKIEGAFNRQDPILQTYEEALWDRLDLWDDLIAGRVPDRKESGDDRAAPTLMELPVTAAWHQGSPYNDLAPVLTPGSDEHCVVGCVATAMGQIMKYWQWPHTGNGSGSTTYDYRYRTTWDSAALPNDPNIDPSSWWNGRFEWVAWGGGLLRMNGYWDGTLYGGARRACNGGGPCTDADYLDAVEDLWNGLTQASTNCAANFGTASYNWNIIEDVHQDPPDGGDLEVAELCYHAGIAVNMGYGVWSSSAGSPRDAFVDHFRYDPDAVFNDRNATTMVDEIQWLRPIQLCGSSNSGGHCWVVAGYNQGTSPWEFLMNLGWGGGTTEWFICDDVFPIDQVHAVKVAPLNVVKFVGGSAGGDGSPGSPYQTIYTALASAADGATLIFKAGSTHTITGDSLTIDRPMTLRGHNVTITKP